MSLNLTLGQRCIHVIQMFCVYWVDNIPANTGHSPNAVSMLGQRRRRWANIEITLGECPVFAGMEAACAMLFTTPWI